MLLSGTCGDYLAERKYSIACISCFLLRLSHSCSAYSVVLSFAGTELSVKWRCKIPFGMQRIGSPTEAERGTEAEAANGLLQSDPTPEKVSARCEVIPDTPEFSQLAASAEVSTALRRFACACKL